MKIPRRNLCSRIAMALAAAAITSATFGAINAAVTPPTSSVAVVTAPAIGADTALMRQTARARHHGLWLTRWRQG